MTRRLPATVLSGLRGAGMDDAALRTDAERRAAPL